MDAALHSRLQGPGAQPEGQAPAEVQRDDVHLQTCAGLRMANQAGMLRSIYSHISGQAATDVWRHIDIDAKLHAPPSMGTCWRTRSEVGCTARMSYEASTGEGAGPRSAAALAGSSAATVSLLSCAGCPEGSRTRPCWQCSAPATAGPAAASVSASSGLCAHLCGACLSDNMLAAVMLHCEAMKAPVFVGQAVCGLVGSGHCVIAEPQRSCHPFSVHKGFGIVARQAQIIEHALMMGMPVRRS